MSSTSNLPTKIDPPISGTPITKFSMIRSIPDEVIWKFPEEGRDSLQLSCRVSKPKWFLANGSTAVIHMTLYDSFSSITNMDLSSLPSNCFIYLEFSFIDSSSNDSLSVNGVVELKQQTAYLGGTIIYLNDTTEYSTCTITIDSEQKCSCKFNSRTFLDSAVKCDVYPLFAYYETNESST